MSTGFSWQLRLQVCTGLYPAHTCATAILLNTLQHPDEYRWYNLFNIERQQPVLVITYQWSSVLKILNERD
jgi:hypothetical protein